jgi:hypothetical protein
VPCTLYRSFNEIEKRRGEQTQAMPQKKSGGTELRHRLIFNQLNQFNQ